jgi:hypothetical protein
MGIYMGICHLFVCDELGVYENSNTERNSHQGVLGLYVLIYHAMMNNSGFWWRLDISCIVVHMGIYMGMCKERVFVYRKALPRAPKTWYIHILYTRKTRQYRYIHGYM